jgi:hypothetical protein
MKAADMSSRTERHSQIMHIDDVPASYTSPYRSHCYSHGVLQTFGVTWCCFQSTDKPHGTNKVKANNFNALNNTVIYSVNKTTYIYK